MATGLGAIVAQNGWLVDFEYDVCGDRWLVDLI